MSASVDMLLWPHKTHDSSNHIQIVGDLSIGRNITGSLTLNGNFSLGAHFRITLLTLSLSEKNGEFIAGRFVFDSSRGLPCTGLYFETISEAFCLLLQIVPIALSALRILSAAVSPASFDDNDNARGGRQRSSK